MRAALGVTAHRQRLVVPTCNRVIAGRQRHRLRCVNPPARDRKVDQRPPDVLGKKVAEVNFDLRKRAERTQIGVLPGGCSGVSYSGNMGGEVEQPVDRARRGQQQPAQLDRIEPFERRPLDRSVVEVEAIEIDPRSHFLPPQKARATPGSGP